MLVLCPHLNKMRVGGQAHERSYMTPKAKQCHEQLKK